MTQNRPVVAMIHAVPSGAEIANQAFAEVFPEAVVWNLLDDRLLEDARSAGGLGPGLRRRMLRLIDHVFQEGADGLLLTCSSYGPVVDTARRLWGKPVYKADEAMFRAALGMPVGRLLVLASTPPAVPAAVEQLEALKLEFRGGPEIGTVLCEEAASIGHPEELATVLAQAARTERADVVLLAQYSLTPAATALRAMLGVPVLSGAGAAAQALRRDLIDSPALIGSEA
ncbi:aspartate/glutamate racemase family protein [Streptomyces sp. GbtcB7]|uniref:aspartate/glutamate racemase family protein n=1 Tax=Streptomyces sp. GbtcB7 TaxID=2824752 RepID=UPI0027E57B16|nr:aspartate/glutamate racemase family protein [Streptomyces sp. GbtcB7]